VLNGSVHGGDGAVPRDAGSGDAWTLTIRDQTYTVYPQPGDGLQQVAQAFADQLNAGPGFTAPASGGVLTIDNPGRFNFGSTSTTPQEMATAQDAFGAGTITRQTTPTLTDGTTPVTFNTATVALNGPATVGDTWAVTVTRASDGAKTILHYKVAANDGLPAI